MLSLYEILKASKTGIAPDMWTALTGKNWGGKDSGAEVKELTGIPPLGFKADGTPLLDYLISGNMSQTGTPTPTTPIQPQETGEKTSQLFDYQTMSDGLVGSFLNSDGTITTNVASSSWTITKYIPVAGREFTLQRQASGGAPSICLYDSSQTYITGLAYNGNGTVTVSANTDVSYIRFTYYLTENTDVIMLNTGSTPLPYEPYGYKIPISSANTTTPVYLGEVETTRKIKKLVLTGKETITFASEDDNRMVGFFAIPNMGMESSETGYCNILQWKNSYSQSEYNRIVANGSVRFYMSIAKSALPEPTFEGFIAYLAAQYAAGTPVTVWYVLATEETGIVNEPLRKIGDYADTLSYEQAGVSIPTLNGQTVVDVDTTLKPSEMYIKYKG